MRRRAVLALAAAVAAAGCGSARPGAPVAAPPARALPASSTSHVVVLVMENKEEQDVLGSGSAPFLARLARGGGVAARSYGVTHPSLPNYLALTSGSTWGIASDCTHCRVAGRNLVDSLAAAHRSWKAYMEDLPAPCSAVPFAGGYAKKHDPFAYYDDVAGDPARCRRIVGFDALAADLRRGALPDFASVSPNLCDDTHDCGVDAGDRFLAGLVPRLVRELGPHGFLVVTWDEGRTGEGCCGGSAGGRIATVVAGPDVRRGARMTAPVDHYGVLRTVEQALGLPLLGASADPRHGSLAPLFRGGRVWPAAPGLGSVSR